MAAKRKVEPTANGNGQTYNWFDDPILTRKLSAVLNTVTTRSVAELQGRTDFDPRRSLEDECGWPQMDALISISTYRQLYDRDAIAARVVELMPKESWQVTPEIIEDDDEETDTPFEQAFKELPRQLKGGPSWHVDEDGSIIWTELRKADILSRIGHFGLLLMGIDDGRNLADPADGVVESATYGQGDSAMTEDEEQNLKEPKEKGALVPNPKPPKRDESGKVIENKWQPWVVVKEQAPTLNAQERALVTRWSKEREFVRNVNERLAAAGHAPVCNARQALKAAARITANDQLGQAADQFSGGSTWQPAPLMGTDQQYFGVQFGPTETYPDKPTTQKHQLKFLRSFSEDLVQVVRYEWNINNPRFGMPVMYRITLNDPRELHSGIGLPLATVFVHWSRVIHVADHHDNVSSSAIFAPPAMRPVLNDIMNNRKVSGAGPEGYFRSCIPSLFFETHPSLGGDVPVDVNTLRDMMEDMGNSIQKFGVLQGMQANSVGPEVVDPTPHHTMTIQRICIKLGCPQRVFMGSERGELASSQDDAAWNDRLRERQHKYISPLIIAPFIDRLISMGVLPEPKQVKEQPPELGPDGLPNDEDGSEQPFAPHGPHLSAPEGEDQGGAEDANAGPMDEGQQRSTKAVPGAFNAFCPTGEGGGVDPSCSPGREIESQDEGGVREYSRVDPDQLPFSMNDEVPSDWSYLAGDAGKLDDVTIRHADDIKPSESSSRQSIDAMKEAIRSGADLPPIVVEFDGEKGFSVLDGNTRLLAAKELGYKRIPVREHIIDSVENRLAVFNKRASNALFGSSPDEQQGPKMPERDPRSMIDGGPVQDDEQPREDGAVDAREQADAPEGIDGMGGDLPDEGDPDQSAAQQPGYRIKWPDLDSLTDKDRAALCLQNTQALTTYGAQGGEDLIPLESFLGSDKFMNMDKTEVAKIMEASTAKREADLESQQQMVDEQGFQPLPPPGFHDPENPVPTKLGPGESLHDPSSGETMGKSPFKPPAGGASPFPPAGPGAGGPPGAGKPPGSGAPKPGALPAAAQPKMPKPTLEGGK